PETGHVGTDLGDVAGDVAAGPEGERGLERRDPLAHEDVQVVQRAGADADEHLSGSRLRVGDVLKPELLGTAELVEGERLHFDSPGCSKPIRGLTRSPSASHIALPNARAPFAHSPYALASLVSGNGPQWENWPRLTTPAAP